MATISQDPEQLGHRRYFVLYTRITQGMCLQNIIVITVTIRVLEPGQRFRHTLWILRGVTAVPTQSKHIGSTLYGGPNNYKIMYAESPKINHLERI